MANIINESLDFKVILHQYHANSLLDDSKMEVKSLAQNGGESWQLGEMMHQLLKRLWHFLVHKKSFKFFNAQKKQALVT